MKIKEKKVTTRSPPLVRLPYLGWWGRPQARHFPPPEQEVLHRAAGNGKFKRTQTTRAARSLGLDLCKDTVDRQEKSILAVTQCYLAHLSNTYVSFAFFLIIHAICCIVFGLIIFVHVHDPIRASIYAPPP